MALLCRRKHIQEEAGLRADDAVSLDLQEGNHAENFLWGLQDAEYVQDLHLTGQFERALACSDS